MASGVTSAGDAKPAARRRRFRRATADATVVRPHVRRFALVYVVLLLAVAGAAVAAVLLKDKPHQTAQQRRQSAPWSKWRPVAPSPAPADQIALHTMLQYRLPTGPEFTHVLTTEPRWQGAPIVGVATISELGGETQFVPTSDSETVMYSLCGLGRGCVVPSSPAAAPGVDIVLERESLELALYTFRYLPRAQNVIVVMPPGTAPVPAAVFLRRPDLAAALRRPLVDTIAPYPRGVIRVTRRDADVVAQLVSPHLAGIDAQKTSDGSVLFVLKRLPVG